LSGTRGRGKDGLWKAWENDKTVFPLFPQPLEIAAAIPTLPPPRLRRAEISLKARQNKNRENDAQYHYPGGPNYMVKVGHAGIANSRARCLLIRQHRFSQKKEFLKDYSICACLRKNE
jgi:hypothetical protein